MISHYTKGKNACQCCGESILKFLSIDHKNNDGAEHRRKIEGRKNISATYFNYKIKQNNFPKGLQILCYNCNYGKARNGGICPHKTQ